MEGEDFTVAVKSPSGRDCTFIVQVSRTVLFELVEFCFKDGLEIGVYV